MTIKIRELTIKANIVEKSSRRTSSSSRFANAKETRRIGSLMQEFYNDEFKKRRER